MLVLLSFSQQLSARTQVNVGGYYYPPFVEVSSGKVSGITLTMLEMLNRQQNQYQFNFVLTTAKQRYQDFSDKKYDMIFFENPAWDWQDFPLEISDVYLTGEEIFIALQKPGRGQKYFDNITDKLIAGILGYHYRFLDYNIDELELTLNYEIVLSENHQDNLDLLFAEKVDVVIINRSYLQQYFHRHPKKKNKLLLSDKLDQRYTHCTLIRKNSPITVKSFNLLLKQLKNNGSLKHLWQQFGLEPD
ncbi:transporter substrate-binding domain-containing protein [Thalassomonas viridans]|uniref:Transporter substrate-binding domain-containing protein n=1 Tax=Thalassomonas viridans TaxID=137584 RepID=A0AAE9Z7B9_9GAMM|nr:transporter substrate-binding domain-containing protein [Thalassomonas viridans]WDE07582.1 transporter substrate-binding domain-containing protein [Thalassomonas viridans]